MRITADELKMIRKTYNMTQSELAAHIGVTDAYISMVESGKAPMTDALTTKITVMFALTPMKLAEIKSVHERYSLTDKIDRDMTK